MRVLIAGMDGYLGRSLALYLTERGHAVAGVDDYSRRRWVEETGSWSGIPIRSMKERLEAAADRFGKEIAIWPINHSNDLCSS